MTPPAAGPVGGPDLWLRGDDVASLGSGNPVLTWPDATPNHHDVIYNVVQTPTVNTDISPYVGVAFGHFTDKGQVPNALNVGPDCTVYAVGQQSALTSGVSRVCFASQSFGRNDALLSLVGAALGDWDGVQVVTLPLVGGNFNRHVFAVRRIGQVVTFTRETDLAPVYSPNPVVGIRLQVPCYEVLTGTHLGSYILFELIVYSRGVADDEHALNLAYLRTKYGL